MKSKNIFLAILILSTLGFTLSAWALQLHYDTRVSTFCNFNDFFSCETVNKSAYASIAGVPVAAIGLVGYLLLGALAAIGYCHREQAPGLIRPLLILSGGALLFSLYLTYLEFFVLHALCPLCLGSQLMILGIFILSLLLHKNRKRERKKPD